MLTLEVAPTAFVEARHNLTPEKINDLIMVHYPLVMGMAKKFARKHEVQPDDYTGVAGLALVLAINNALRYLVEPEGLTKYVVTYVRKRLMTFYRTDRAVAIPARTQNFFYALGYLNTIEIRQVTDDDLNCVWDSRIMEDLLEVCPEEFTRQVAHLRVEGHTDKEIASLLGVPHSTVWRERLKLRRLLKGVLNDCAAN